MPAKYTKWTNIWKFLTPLYSSQLEVFLGIFFIFFNLNLKFWWNRPVPELVRKPRLPEKKTLLWTHAGPGRCEHMLAAAAGLRTAFFSFLYLKIKKIKNICRFGNILKIGACRPATGRRGPICKKNNYLWTPEGVGGPVARPGATCVRTKQTWAVENDRAGNRLQLCSTSMRSV